MEAGGCLYQFRIALLGDAAVGKTSLLRRYVAGAPGAPQPEPEPEAEPPTVGVEFYSRALQLPAGPRVKLQLWDTAGHERYRCGAVGRGVGPTEGVDARPPGQGVPQKSQPQRPKESSRGPCPGSLVLHSETVILQLRLGEPRP